MNKYYIFGFVGVVVSMIAIIIGRKAGIDPGYVAIAAVSTVMGFTLIGVIWAIKDSE